MTCKHEQHPMEKNFHDWSREKMQQEINEYARAKEFSSDLLRVVKRAYRKHGCGDDSIGWTELQDELCDTLCNVMGDEEFNKIFHRD